MDKLYEGNTFYGTVKVGERGQIVIPKKTREYYGINAGDSLIVYSDNDKIFKIVKEDLVRSIAIKMLETVDTKD
ncbi:MAG: AbrB/MazE/SpoVT family DNA-binding domain-containing protein [Methanobacterium sp.]|uniref:AbrB/MazE/SpoVT family DNA-binding domain-containing protein n=1 Tax=Methanobacterium sp. TaxID=2164 RepID=UPI003C792AAC